MSQRFVKGLTNNHLTWVMVDATDFATPESAMSAATTIKIYGKLRSATGTNFVSSGTGSLTNDITHVGASATGVYTIALAKADLSDASAAWYDQYVVVLGGTGAAQQVLVVDGGIIESSLSAIASDAHSAAILGASHASDAQSQALLATSMASDAYSAALLAQSYASDAHSMATANSDALSNALSALVVIDDFLDAEIAQINSRVLLAQSYASDAQSQALLATSMASDALSAATLLAAAHAEPTGVPAANATPLDKLGYVFAALRNKVTVTSTKLQFYDDADVAMWEKDLTDDGTTYTETEGNAI